MSTFRVAADLPGLPGVPSEVSGVRCFDCRQRTATVRHEQQGDDVRVTLACECGSIFSLLPGSGDAYLLGMEVGVLTESARRGDPRVSTR
jgi:hypothetical protein